MSPCHHPLIRALLSLFFFAPSLFIANVARGNKPKFQQPCARSCVPLPKRRFGISSRCGGKSLHTEQQHSIGLNIPFECRASFLSCPSFRPAGYPFRSARGLTTRLYLKPTLHAKSFSAVNPCCPKVSRGRGSEGATIIVSIALAHHTAAEREFGISSLASTSPSHIAFTRLSNSFTRYITVVWK